MAEIIKITVPGVKKAFKSYSYLQAIAEYIWNGFDAKASCVELLFTANVIGGITEFAIRDNGYGIVKDRLTSKFVPFFESDKEIDPNPRVATSAVHGKNGVGRLTFFHFANVATWETVYADVKARHRYSITVDVESLDKYSTSESVETPDPTGTKVSFFGIRGITSDKFDTEIKKFLMLEFGWFLELNKAKGFCIKINGWELDYPGLFGSVPENFILRHDTTGTPFEVRYVQWNELINKEYSRYYFINSNENELFKETTTLNNKGDHFYHSVYIKSRFFDDFDVGLEYSANQGRLSGHSRWDAEFKFLISEVDKFLRKRRRPFLKAYTDKLVADLDKDGAFPHYNSANAWDKTRRIELEAIVRGLYQVEPKLFSDLNIEQKKTFVRLLNLVMDSDETEQLFEILQEIVELDTLDRAELAQLLKTSRLSRIIATIKLIEDRYKAVADLRALLFNEDLDANEPDHIQKMVEAHYWLFGEQYHLVTAAEPKFEEALRRYIYLLRGEKTDIPIDHPDRKKEMDIFAVRQDLHNDTMTIKNIVIELKNPKIKLGKNELDQVDNYLNVVLKQPEFNASNMVWEFYLVGNAYDTSGHIERQFENARNHGEKSLAFKTDRYKTYVKTWSEIFSDFELRHKFLNDKLVIERDKLTQTDVTANEIIGNIDANTAKGPPEISVPKE